MGGQLTCKVALHDHTSCASERGQERSCEDNEAMWSERAERRAAPRVEKASDVRQGAERRAAQRVEKASDVREGAERRAAQRVEKASDSAGRGLGQASDRDTLFLRHDSH